MSESQTSTSLSIDVSICTDEFVAALETLAASLPGTVATAELDSCFQEVLRSEATPEAFARAEKDIRAAAFDAGRACLVKVIEARDDGRESCWTARPGTATGRRRTRS